MKHKQYGIKDVILFAGKNVVKLEPAYIPVCMMNAILVNAVPILEAFSIKVLINQITFAESRLEASIHCLAVVLGILLVKAIQVLCVWKVDKMNMKVMNFFQQQNGRHVMELNYWELENVQVQVMIENMYLMHSLVSSVMINLCNILGGLIGILFCMALLQNMSKIGAIIICFCLLLEGYTNIKTQKVCLQEELKFTDEKRRYEYFHKISRDVRIGQEIRIFSLQKFWMNKLNSMMSSYNNFHIKIQNKKLTAGIIYALALGINIGCLLFMVYNKYLIGQIDIGDFSMYCGFVFSFSFAVERITEAVTNIISQEEVLEKYYEFQQLPIVEQGENMSPSMKEAFEIQFHDVWFRYPETSDYVLKNINFTFHSDEVISIVGENGAGKTTFVKLLLRLYEPTKGEILMNGIPITNYSYRAYMEIISPVFQDFSLFAFSIKENITIGNISESEKIWNAIKKSGMEQEVKRLPHGLDTYIMAGNGWDAVNLSGGEMQKLAIARAFYKDAPIAVLDEPTASLDPISEYNIYNRFNKWISNKSAIYISHRMSSAKFSDKIIYFSNGSIKESGTHKDLLRLRGGYFKLYQTQAQYYQK